MQHHLGCHGCRTHCWRLQIAQLELAHAAARQQPQQPPKQVPVFLNRALRPQAQRQQGCSQGLQPGGPAPGTCSLGSVRDAH